MNDYEHLTDAELDAIEIRLSQIHDFEVIGCGCDASYAYPVMETDAAALLAEVRALTAERDEAQERVRIYERRIGEAYAKINELTEAMRHFCATCGKPLTTHGYKSPSRDGVYCSAACHDAAPRKTDTLTAVWQRTVWEKLAALDRRVSELEADNE